MEICWALILAVCVCAVRDGVDGGQERGCVRVEDFCECRFKIFDDRNA